MKSSPISGFTLIELLIVIAIIGLLSAALIPNLLSARTRATDMVAYGYLREAVQIQIAHWSDAVTFATSVANLETTGLKVVPENVTFNVVDADGLGFCMTAQVSGNSKIYHATATSGITDSLKSPVCTVAN